jgi:hypothetical protein
MDGNTTLKGNFEHDTALIKSLLRVDESFDLAMRSLTTPTGQKCAFFYVTGFINSDTAHDIIRYCVGQSQTDISSERLPSTEAQRSDDANTVVSKILSGMTALIVEGDSRAFLMDTRKYPFARFPSRKTIRCFAARVMALARHCFLTPRLYADVYAVRGSPFPLRRSAHLQKAIYASALWREKPIQNTLKISKTSCFLLILKA